MVELENLESSDVAINTVELHTFVILSIRSIIALHQRQLKQAVSAV